jgi:hypothetical protein
VEKPAVVKPFPDPTASKPPGLAPGAALQRAGLLAGTLLEQAAAALKGRSAAAASSADENLRQLERELEEARRQGRWLSHDEREEIEAAVAQQQRQRDEEQRRRRSLLILLAVCLLLPPFWPLAVGLTAYLLFPRTMRRLTITAVVVAVLAMVLLLAVIVLVVLLH